MGCRSVLKVEKRRKPQGIKVAILRRRREEPCKIPTISRSTGLLQRSTLTLAMDNNGDGGYECNVINGVGKYRHWRVGICLNRYSVLMRYFSKTRKTKMM